jgi:hypothetical protein
MYVQPLSTILLRNTPTTAKCASERLQSQNMGSLRAIDGRANDVQRPAEELKQWHGV